MILFFEEGRLGNQLFQVDGLLKSFGGHKLLLFGLDDAEQVVEADRVLFFNGKSWIRQLLFWLIKKTVSISSALRIITSACEVQEPGETHLALKYGLFYGVVYFQRGFFQSHMFLENMSNEVRFRDDFLSIKRRFASLDLSRDREFPSVFVHVRGGDYSRWPVPDYPAILPPQWYKQCMQECRHRLVNPKFFVFSDDDCLCDKVLEGEDDAIRVRGSLREDLASMMACDHAVISASSLSWWAAHSIKENNAEDAPILLAPLYWAGHSRGAWYPAEFRTSWLEYRKVER